MIASSPLRRPALLVAFAAILSFLPACGEQATQTAPPPSAATAPPPAPSKADAKLGGGSNAAEDTTLNPALMK